jgi:hypothetical protein
MALALPPQLGFYWPPEKIRKIVSEQVVLALPFWGFDQARHVGQLVIHRDLADCVREVFEQLCRARFPIASMVPISTFGWDDTWSMSANNCVGFHFRKKTGLDDLSWHAYGRAIDINPALNPYSRDGVILPPGARHTLRQPGTCTPESLPVRLFKSYGFVWGGDWTSLKDYMHFELPFEP